MITRIIIARHGNTFTAQDKHMRIGVKTDIDLVEEHLSRSIGKYLKDKNIMPNAVFSGPLKRHIQTAELAIEEFNPELGIIINNNFTEVDYAEDEGKTEEQIIARISQDTFDKWNKEAIVPKGWIVNSEAIIKSWLNFGNLIEEEYKDTTALMVSSTGIIRYSPHLTGDFKSFTKENSIKVATGAICIFEKNDNDKNWHCVAWNIKPYEEYSK